MFCNFRRDLCSCFISLEWLVLNPYLWTYINRVISILSMSHYYQPNSMGPNRFRYEKRGKAILCRIQSTHYETCTSFSSAEWWTQTYITCQQSTTTTARTTVVGRSPPGPSSLLGTWRWTPLPSHRYSASTVRPVPPTPTSDHDHLLLHSSYWQLRGPKVHPSPMTSRWTGLHPSYNPGIHSRLQRHN